MKPDMHTQLALGLTWGGSHHTKPQLVHNMCLDYCKLSCNVYLVMIICRLHCYNILTEQCINLVFGLVVLGINKIVLYLIHTELEKNEEYLSSSMDTNTYCNIIQQRITEMCLQRCTTVLQKV